MYSNVSVILAAMISVIFLIAACLVRICCSSRERRRNAALVPASAIRRQSVTTINTISDERTIHAEIFLVNDDLASEFRSHAISFTPSSALPAVLLAPPSYQEAVASTIAPPQPPIAPPPPYSVSQEGES